MSVIVVMDVPKPIAIHDLNVMLIVCQKKLIIHFGVWSERKANRNTFEFRLLINDVLEMYLILCEHEFNVRNTSSTHRSSQLYFI